MSMSPKEMNQNFDLLLTLTREQCEKSDDPQAANLLFVSVTLLQSAFGDLKSIATSLHTIAGKTP